VTNTSPTGGYLLPDPAGPAPREGQDLNDFIQAWIVGVTGLPGNLVLPAFQGEPPVLPLSSNAWAAFNITSYPEDDFAQVAHDPAGNGGLGWDLYEGNETIEVLVSFYDIGTNGAAAANAKLLRRGAAIAQNREPLQLAGFALRALGTPQPAPVLVKQRWQYRVDLPITLARRVVVAYPVQNVLTPDIQLHTTYDITTTSETGTPTAGESGGILVTEESAL
jgi:hypothetical protein